MFLCIPYFLCAFVVKPHSKICLDEVRHILLGVGMEHQQGLPDFNLGHGFEFDQLQPANLFPVDLGNRVLLTVAVPPIVLTPDNRPMLAGNIRIVAQVDVVGRAAPDVDRFARQGMRLFDVPAPHGDVHQLRAKVDVIRRIEHLRDAPPLDHPVQQPVQRQQADDRRRWNPCIVNRADALNHRWHNLRDVCRYGCRAEGNLFRRR